jgi:hypothetical protein
VCAPLFPLSPPTDRHNRHQKLKIHTQNTDSKFIRQLKANHQNTNQHKKGDPNLKSSLSQNERKELQYKLITTLNAQISHLSTEFQQILADDLITALQNRLTVLTRIQATSRSTNPKNLL